MATKKITGVPELDAMIAQLNKKFEKEIITEEPYKPQGAIPTGSAALDAALGVGGLAKGIVAEVLGEPSSGKTSFALQVLKNAQAQREPDSDIRDILIDIEHTSTEEFIQGFGVNTSKLIHVRPETAEQALQIARDLPKTGKVGVVIIDSVGALETSKKQQKDVGEIEPGGIAKLMHDTCRSISKTASETGTTFLFINHITYKIGVMYGKMISYLSL